MDTDSFRRYVGAEDSDLELLRGLWPHVAPHLDGLCERFYGAVLQEPETAAILAAPERVSRLTKSLKRWIESTLNDPVDEAYEAARHRVGVVHFSVGVNHAMMHAAMAVVRAWLVERAHEALEDPFPTLLAVCRATELDLAMMTSMYHMRREDAAKRDVQSVLIEHMPSMVALVSKTGEVLAVTPSIGARLGPPGASSGIGSVFPRNVIDAADLEDRVEQACNGQVGVMLPRVDVEIDGDMRHLSIVVAPVPHSTPAAVVQIEDHTDAVVNAGLLERQESLAQLGVLSATIAHELRNPLAGMSGAIQVIRQSKDVPERFAPILDRVLEQIRVLTNQVSDLLSFARPRDAEMYEDVDLGDIARAVVDNLSADHDGVVFAVRGAGVAQADPSMVRQILMNLGINAAQAMDGNGRVSFEVEPRLVRVRDSGPGIPEEIRDSLFQPFRTTKVHGTGLGLAICDKLARTMGAEVVVVPCDNGACFELRFGGP